jgi:L,D-peptidoglycan transpeptidase YkuD (ErfK/YbiS/YcfS/YnhG family)
MTVARQKDLRFPVKFVAHADGRFEFGARTLRCAVGRSGVKPAADKREGDGFSPAGAWAIRKVLYRPDVGAPKTALPLEAIGRDHGWSDDPDDPAYNTRVTLPYRGSFEKLWRDDHMYDLVVVLGHNDDPPKPHMGSCIFLHLAREDGSPTQGCVALAREDLEAVLAEARPGDVLEIVLD